MSEQPQLPPIHGEMIQLSPTVQQQWLYNERILSFVVKDASRATIDTWMKAIMRVGGKWNPEQPLLIMYQLNAIPLTPYLRQKATELTQMSMHLHGRTATILPNNFGSQMMRIFMEYDLRRIRSNIVQRVFYKRDHALEWLLEALMDR